MELSFTFTLKSPTKKKCRILYCIHLKYGSNIKDDAIFFIYLFIYFFC